jgi:hypothetical protein
MVREMRAKSSLSVEGANSLLCLSLSTHIMEARNLFNPLPVPKKPG